MCTLEASMCCIDQKKHGTRFFIFYGRLSHEGTVTSISELQRLLAKTS